MQTFSVIDLKNMYPDEWILLGNPIKDTNEIDVISGILIYHSRDKKEVCYIGRGKTQGYDKITLIYTGSPKHKRKIYITF
jgi:hypothetical protein